MDIYILLLIFFLVHFQLLALSSVLQEDFCSVSIFSGLAVDFIYLTWPFKSILKSDMNFLFYHLALSDTKFFKKEAMGNDSNSQERGALWRLKFQSLVFIRLYFIIKKEVNSKIPFVITVYKTLNTFNKKHDCIWYIHT